MKEKIIIRINKRTHDLNNLLEHREILKNELNNANINIERLTAQIIELKDILESLEEPETT